jgi:hypothetical protein
MYAFLVGPQTGADSYHLTRLWIIRGLGFIYFVAFAIIFFQGRAMFGVRGLLPMDPFIAQAIGQLGGDPITAFEKLPSLFYFIQGDYWYAVFGVLGMIGGGVLMAGLANVPILIILWLLQSSFVNSGQLFFSYGWQTQLLEFTFLCMFLVPPLDPRLKTATYPAPRIVIWALRWMLFRLMFGAGMIKIRGDQCWRDLTCMIYHYETQPNPHPLSYIYHQMPNIFHYGGALFNHFVELIVPFGLFGPVRVRRIAGVLTIIFQLILISSGNLAWLNWLTLLMCIPVLDDEFINRFYPKRGKIKWAGSPVARRKPGFISKTITVTILTAFTAGVGYLSYRPAINLISRNQAMNTSYDGWHFINSYGAFGSIGKVRGEVIISGTQDEVITDQTKWTEYEFKCAPGDVTRRPCLITPYHYHLDWQIWFSGMRPELQEEWLFRLIVRLLQNEPDIKDLFAVNPFGEQAPRHIKMDLYRYEFTAFPAWPERWWRRTFLKPYMPPISLADPMAQKYAN